MPCASAYLVSSSSPCLNVGALPPTPLPVLSAQILLTVYHDKCQAGPASTILS